MFRYIRLYGYLAAPCLFLCVIITVLRGSDLEYQVKAEYMERFTRFIEWPAGSFASAEDPFLLCVTGENPFGEYLDRMAAERRFQGRGMQVRYLHGRESFSDCHILFISSSEAPQLQAILNETSSLPVLTIADTGGFLEEGVLMNLYLSEGFVRFEINLPAARKSGLKLSSRLLKLGRVRQ